MGLSLFHRRERPVDSRSLQRQRAFVPARRPKPSSDPLDRALEVGRLGRILAGGEPWVSHPRYAAARDEVARRVDELFALVPEGTVSLPVTLSDEPGQPEVDCETAAYLLARCCVTNAAFQYFVDAGGYSELEFWPEEIWPHLAGFQDQTGEPGPRYWRNGCHDRRLARHPVVGITWYEAVAYAQWAGYRLPTEAEWQTAASWRVSSTAHAPRRYPWGDTLELHRCNIRAAGYGGTLPVDARPDGAAPNGVRQLIGNVWEWTKSDFLCADQEGRTVVGDSRMYSIRGGAFDTYFAWQATAAFRTGMPAMARCDNVGFRCALDLAEKDAGGPFPPAPRPPAIPS